MLNKTVGGCPTASFFLLRRQKKETKEKATSVCHCYATAHRGCNNHGSVKISGGVGAVEKLGNDARQSL
jgi:hypothetical protein